MSSDVGIGKLIEGEQQRDAIHVAISPVVAASGLMPGQRIGFVEPGNFELVDFVDLKDSIGIVDPFLRNPIFKGERFWMFLYPNTITSLRHDWMHPAFETPEYVKKRKEASEAWLRKFCDEADCPSYDVLIAAAVGDHYKNAASDRNPDPDGYVGYYNSENDGDYLHFGGRDAHGEIPPEFWDHVENVTGRECHLRAKYFSCSC